MEAIGEHIKRHNNSEEKTSIFAEYLYCLINQYGFTNAADLYNKANVFRHDIENKIYDVYKANELLENDGFPDSIIVWLWDFVTMKLLKESFFLMMTQ